MDLNAFGDLDARSFADQLEETVIPAILKAGQRGSYSQVLDAYSREPAKDRQQALWLEAKQFAPPNDLPGASEVHAVLVGMIAFRAATSEYVERFPEVQSRHHHAAS